MDFSDRHGEVRRWALERSLVARTLFDKEVFQLSPKEFERVHETAGPPPAIETAETDERPQNPDYRFRELGEHPIG